MEKLDESLFMHDEPVSKPILWSKTILQSTGFVKNSTAVFESLIDPRLIYIDEGLTSEEF